MQRNKNLILLLIVLILIILGANFWYKKYYRPDTKENVVVAKVDLTAENPKSKVPANFPSNIPLELEEVTDGSDIQYPDRGVLVSAITYKTTKTLAQIFDIYTGYMRQEGFEMDKKNTNYEQGVIYGNKGTSVLGVIVSPQDQIDGKRSVHVVYTQNTIK